MNSGIQKIKLLEAEDEMRKTAIEVLGDVPWGTHFCQFYETKEDLIDTLVPYFKEGLKNNELCVWITSEPLRAEDAQEALRKEIKNLNDYIKNGQIEILNYSQWYIKSGRFDLGRVLQAWIDKENQALKNGFDGLRLTGNTFWLEEKVWGDFINYEAAVNRIINKHRMLALCTYPLKKCSASEIIDVVSNHQFALIKQEGRWKIIESSEYKKAQNALRESQEHYQSLFENSPIPIWEVDLSGVKAYLDQLRASGVRSFRSYFKSHMEELDKLAGKVKIVDINRESIQLFNVSHKKDLPAHLAYFFAESPWPVFRDAIIALAEGKTKFESELTIQALSGNSKVLVLKFSIIPGYQQALSKVLVSFFDITKRKMAEETIQTSQRYLRILNKHTEIPPLLKEFVSETKKLTGCSAASVIVFDRLGNISYKAFDGISNGFYDLEKSVSIQADKDIWINIIKKKVVPRFSCFTEGGSFYVNDSALFLETLSEETMKRIIIRFHDFGYESFAIVPILIDKTMLGQIHIAFARKNMVLPEQVKTLEGIAMQLGTAIKRLEIQEQLQKSERELALRNKIANIFLTVTDEGVYNEVLQVILKELKSRYGLFGYIDERGGDLVLASLTQNIWEECKVPAKTVVFPREKWGGIWGQSLKEKKSLLNNNPLAVPRGHIPISRVMVVPIIFKNEAIGIFTVANKEAEYTEYDKELLVVVAEKCAPVLRARLQRDSQIKRRVYVERKLKNLQMQISKEPGYAGIISRDPKMLEIFETIRELGEIDVPVLIQGESGTGKELVALAIHNEGHRAHQPFLPVNCGALPEGLLESELFGHVRGAFTGAVRNKKGRFELANNGTIFLDEIGDLSPALQVKLLRVLQDGTFERVGSEKTVKVNVRVIAATNKVLQREIKEGRFRSDLFYRLCVVPITLPPLRERRSDIPLLANHILERILKEQNRKNIEISSDALAKIIDYDWPGNVRELQNAIQYALVKCGGRIISINHLPPTISGACLTIDDFREAYRGWKLNAEVVKRVLAETNGNKLKAAKKLGVGRATLYRFLKSMNGLGNTKTSGRKKT